MNPLNYIFFRKMFLVLSWFFYFIYILFLLTSTSKPAVAVSAFDQDFIGIPNHENVQISHQRDASGKLTIRINISEYDIQHLNELQKKWTLIDLKGETRTWEIGAPQVPVIARSVRLPNFGNVQVNVIHSTYEVLKGLQLYPQQEMTLETKDEFINSSHFSWNESIYKSDRFYPIEITNMSPPAIFRDARIAVLGIHTVQFNPVLQEVKLLKSIEIEILPIGGIGENEIRHSPKPVPSFAGLYRDVIGADDLVLDNMNAPPGQILIITKNYTTNRSAIQPLVNWKNSTGYPIQMQTPPGTTITSNTIQTMINNAFNNFNPPLEFVLLVGDGGPQGQTFMPAHFIDQVATDHPYGQIVGNDILADVSIGRFSIANVSQLQMMMNRTINYEKAMDSDTTWYTRGWGYAGISHGVLSNRPAIRFCNEMMQSRGVTTTFYDEHNGLINTSLLTQRLNPGLLFWAHRAAWVGEISVNDVSTISNINKPFVSLNMTCGSGNWYDTDTGIHEALIRLGTASSPAGAIAGLATATPNTYPAFNNVVATGVYYGLGVLNERQFGPMILSGKYQLWRNFVLSLPVQVNNFSYWNNVMGDVSANLWTGVPRQLQWSIPDTIQRSTNYLDVTLTHQNQPVENVLVTVYKKNPAGTTEIYLRQVTDSRGNVILPISIPSEGELTIAASGIRPEDNWKPLLDTIQIISTPVSISLNSVSMDDDNLNGTAGNNNQTPNPLEIIDVSINLTNSGTITIPNFTGTLISSNPRISIQNETQTWNAIPISSSANSISPFRLSITPNVVDSLMIPLKLVFQSSIQLDTMVIPITIRSIHSILDSVRLFPSQTWEVGNATQLAVYFKNRGGLSLLSPIIGTLTTNSRYVSVTQPVSQFSSFPNTGSITNPLTQRWQLQASPSTPRGTQIPVQVTFSNGAVSDTIRFNVSVGTRSIYDAAGPDEYGYFAYDNLDSALSACPSFQWLEIIPAFGGQGSRLNLFDNANNQDTSIVVRLPFPVRYYGRTYDSVTVCSNGWVAFGAQPYYNNLRNWRLPNLEGPRAMVAPFWDDLFISASNQGIFSYFDSESHRFIITWFVVSNQGDQSENQFQLVMHDANYWRTPTNDTPFLFQYKDFHNLTGLANDVDFATIGIVDETRTRALEISYMNQFTSGAAPISNGYAINRSIYITTQIPDSLLRWIAPNARDTLSIGYPERLVWSGRPSLQTINVDINRNFPTASWQRILSNVPNTGSIEWNVSGPASNNVRLRIVSSDGIEGDTTLSNLIVQIPQPSLELFHPIGNERLPYSVPTMISWGTSELPGNIILELNRNYPSSEWQTIYSNVPALNGSIIWTPSSPISSNARIRIRSQVFSTLADTSNENFSVVAPAYLIVSPNPISAIVPPDDSVATSFSIANLGDYTYDGELYVNTGLDGYNYITSNHPDAPAFEWMNTQNGINGPTGDGANGGPYRLPFSFPFYGQSFDTVYMNTNGWFTLNAPGSITSGSNQQLPFSIMRTFFAVYWNNLITTQGQTKVLMDTINQRAVLSWNGVRISGEQQSSLFFQAILYPNGSIVYQFQSLVCNDTTVTVGLQNYNRSAFFNVFFRTRVPDSSIVYFDTFHPWAYPNRTVFSIPAGGFETVEMSWNTRNRQLDQQFLGNIRFVGNAENTPFTVPVMLLVGVNRNESKQMLPTTIELNQNYPNPFNSVTNISFSVNQKKTIRLSIVNILGEEVELLVDHELDAGTYTIPYDAKQLSSGIYLLRLQSGESIQSKKMVLVK